MGCYMLFITRNLDVLDLLTFIESADPSYPKLGVFTAVIKKKSKMLGSVINQIILSDATIRVLIFQRLL
jgi:hypothetical protein